MSHQDLRKDITGLRAIAVLAVTLFHITHFMNPDSQWFQGGFLGVDIFFVISGFLMTMLIMRGLDNHNFSLYTFYKRRAKRICPALVTVVLVFSLLTVLMFEAFYAERILKDGLRSLAFVSNMRYARLTGYFDLDSSSRMFLHTWSLSVEWQFYLIYPILLLLLSKIVSRQRIGLILVLLTLASLVYGCIYADYAPSSAYYYLPSRAFELLAGSLAYFYPLSFFTQRLTNNTEQQNAKLAQYAEYLGLLCLIVSLVIVGEEDGWPNVWAILPMFGTWLCIAANSPRTALSNPVFQHIGLWSYAIYLVHWPIIVIFVNIGINVSIWILLALIFVAGVALHYGIERRRNYGWLFFAWYFVAAGIIYGCVEYVKKQAETEVTTNVSASEPIGVSFNNDGQITHYGDTSRPVDLILMGDSFARQLLPALHNSGTHIVGITVDGCYSTKGSINLRKTEEEGWLDKCSARYDHFLQAVEQNPDVPIFWAQNWDGYGMYRFASKLNQPVPSTFTDIVKQDLKLMAQDLKGRELYVLSAARKVGAQGNVNFGINCSNLRRMNTAFSNFAWDILECQKRTRIPFNELEMNIEIKDFISSLNKQADPNLANVHYFDVNDALCNEQGCLVMQKDTYNATFGDQSHLSIVGSIPVIDYMLQTIGLQEPNDTPNQSAIPAMPAIPEHK